MRVNVNYQLSSADTATLMLFVEEYPLAAGGCTGNTHQTNGGVKLAIHRGTGQTVATVVWPGDAPVYNTGGFLAIGANLWTSDLTRQIRSFGLRNETCYRFAKATSVLSLRLPPSPPPSPPRPAPPAATPTPPAFYHWQAASNGSVSGWAVSGGRDNSRHTLYICRVRSNNDLFPGEVADKGCHYSAATQRELVASNYEVLTADPDGPYRFNFQPSPSPPANALVGGQWADKLYVCQLPYQGGLHVGWAIKEPDGHWDCYLGIGGKQVVLSQGISFLVPTKGFDL